MAKEVSSGIKEPNAITYDLYDELMLRMDKEKGADVFPDSAVGLTVVKVTKPSTAHHDLLFYRFAHHESPVACITRNGESMILMTYELGRAGTRFSIKEADIQERLKELLKSR